MSKFEISKSDLKKFVSHDKTFSFEYPEYWNIEYDDDTLVLWRGKNKTALRITPFLVKTSDGKEFSRDKWVKDTIKAGNAIDYSKKGKLYILHRKDYKGEENKAPIIQKQWEVVTNKGPYICSLTILKNKANTKESKDELKIATRITYSIKEI